MVEMRNPLVLAPEARYASLFDSNAQPNDLSDLNEDDQPEQEDREYVNELANEDRVKDPYEVLKVSADAPVAEIKNAYREAIKRCHPDTVADRSDLIKEAAGYEARLLNEAYDTIRKQRGF
jgi:DnaJ-class molecular chaperone